ncbi:hydroxyacid dehydrogenase [Roseomonas sp. JC162]|uniref:Hydroxyacid dehydrogenase n=1 Tax=Neoroseomonas marina TaxID=1232220 RepID=A0A848EIZ1_9PROT|nr:hydroxyacid dehydrogenase [Neoroseomonas marina]NMJ43370.1 hydroxyacid dehydrogenase [Neoroseomonas marina]
MRVALTDPVEPIAERILTEAGHEIARLSGSGPDALRALCRDADAVMVRQKLPDDLLDHAPRLLAAVRHGVGVDMIPVESCTAHGVLVANVPGSNADAVAEFLVAQMLAAARHVEAMHADHLANGWGPARSRSATATELRGKTLGILGVGDIGSRLGRIAALGFGMRVLGHRRHAAGLPEHIAYAALPDLFAESDYIALACPLTPETQGIVDAAMLARMKPTAWLLNVSRGPVVQEGPLVAALREGRIGGAALDVYWAQPLATDHPLRALPNVILSPHAAGLTMESVETMSRVSATDTVRILAGLRPLNFFNPEAWEASRARRRALGLPMPEEGNAA